MDKIEFAVNVLKYWYLIEFLNQESFPSEPNENKKTNEKIIKGESKRKQVTIYKEILIDSECDLTNILTADNLTYKNHSVISDEISICIGKVRRMDCVEFIKNKFHQEIDLPENNNEKISLIGLKADNHGNYIKGSIFISPLIWGLDCLKNARENISQEQLSDLLSLEGYQHDMQRFDSFLTYEENGREIGELITTELLRDLYNLVTRTYDFPSIPVENKGIVIYKRYSDEEVKSKDMDTFYFSDLAKSFFTNDLKLVEEKLKSKEFGEDSLIQKNIIDYIVGPYAEEKQELEWIDFSKRINLDGTLKQAEFFYTNLDVNCSPIAKWPSKYMPALMQQLAINLGTNKENKYGAIFSVNGPPGTGKTTLLKEIIANNITERAKLLAEYIDPDEAFYRKHFQDGTKRNNGYSKYHYDYFAFKNDEIKNYGMLVASCNNNAVENITKELPDSTSLLDGLSPSGNEAEDISNGLNEVSNLFDFTKNDKTEWLKGEGKNEFAEFPDVYFTKYANDYAYNLENEWDRWGLISVPFGKLSNIKSYANKVLSQYITDFYSNVKIESRKQSYIEAVGQFKAQLDKVGKLREEIHKISGARSEFFKYKLELEKECSKLSKDILTNQDEIKELENNLGMLVSKGNEIVSKYKEVEEALNLQKENGQNQLNVLENVNKCIEEIEQKIMDLEGKRTLIDFFFSLIKKKTMRLECIDRERNKLENKRQEKEEKDTVYQKILDEIRKTEEIVNSLKEDENKIVKDKKVCENDKIRCNNQIESLKQEISNLKEEMKRANREYLELLDNASKTTDVLNKMTVLDKNFWDMYGSEDEFENTKAQVLNPWFTAKYNREREKLFYYALILHKEFFLASKCCAYNISNLLMMWKIKDDGEGNQVNFSVRDRKNSFGDLFNTVFLLTPVVSTTFASAGAMLADIKNPGEIGYLIIDEAGQAQPQMAIGSLYRCRRAIVVGDPRQVEPVVTSEMDILKKVIKNDYNYLYQSKNHSVQEFSDRINRVGRNFIENNTETWVGCPLVVHRRCISPMYDISNAISYNNTMKQQTLLPAPEKEENFCMDYSGWINIAGTENNSQGKDHFVLTQGEKAKEIILKAFLKTKDIPNLFVITPFNSVKNGLVKLIRSTPEYKTNKKIEQWLETHVGTVHKFQGKEADEVIFLLGCDKNSISAVKWVNTNIVNVAVTRAKYRLYVIGDYNVWKESYVMQTVKHIMDSYAILRLKEIAKEVVTEKIEVQKLLKQVPKIESFTQGEELDDYLMSDFCETLNGIFGKDNLAFNKRLEDFGLNHDVMKSLDNDVENNIRNSIKLYSMFTLLKDRYHLEDMDFSCGGVLFCKSMELQLKTCLLQGFKQHFANILVSGKKLSSLKDKEIMIGTFTQILMPDVNREYLANINVTFNGTVCNRNWWDTYYNDLKAFKDLRNDCCHVSKFDWDKVEQLVEVLFKKGEFMKTLVGKYL